MRTKHMMLSALGAGAAYLLRNKQARQKLMNQFQNLTSSSSSSNSKQDTHTP
ncbi:hypothetical protein [Paenibacillus sambharensis]|uniref:hypothetical protein n=1 Tax=Paenibacillus sambharensis TaxID=1803190 RepID=UPI0015E8D8F2|nr:hypothetical protein [Paenibacillus sambharensis]